MYLLLLALLFMILAVFTGLFMQRLKIKMIYHKIFALLAFVFLIVHVAVI